MHQTTNPGDPHSGRHVTAATTILLISRDPIVLSTYSRGLHHEGHRVVQAHTLDQTCRLLDDPGLPSLDAVLIDLTRPTAEAVKILTHMVTHCPGMPLVVMAGPATEDLARQARCRRICLVTAPVLPSDLSCLLRNLVLSMTDTSRKAGRE